MACWVLLRDYDFTTFYVSFGVPDVFLVLFTLFFAVLVFSLVFFCFRGVLKAQRLFLCLCVNTGTIVFDSLQFFDSFSLLLCWERLVEAEYLVFSL